jgi:hypothetical protein
MSVAHNSITQRNDLTSGCMLTNCACSPVNKTRSLDDPLEIDIDDLETHLSVTRRYEVRSYCGCGLKSLGRLGSPEGKEGLPSGTPTAFGKRGESPPHPTHNSFHANMDDGSIVERLRKLFLSPFSFSDIQMNVLVVGMGGA